MKPRTLSAAGMAFVLAASFTGACGSGGDNTPADSRTLEERLFAGNEADFAKQQQLIRDCMVKQGFEHTPIDTRDSKSGPVRFDRDSEDFVKEYGFGISTLFASEFAIKPPDDPNTAYRNSLSEVQQKAYDIALYGQEVPGGGSFSSNGGLAVPAGGGGDDGRPSTFGGAPGGCIGEALKATGAELRPPNQDLFDDLEDLEDRIKADPQMVQAVKKWSACMADAGYQYRDPNQAMKTIQDEFADLTGVRVAVGDGGGFAISVSGAGRDDGQAFDPLANVDKEKLAQLQDKEKRIAMASLKCSQDHVAKVEQKVREKYEADFLADHPDLKDK